MIDKTLHSSFPAVDQDYIDVVVDGVALRCLEVSLQCPDLHSEKSSADETRVPSDVLMHVNVLLMTYCFMVPLTGPHH